MLIIFLIIINFLLQGPLVRWLRVNFGESFIAYIHVKALRLYVESVLRLLFQSLSCFNQINCPTSNILFYCSICFVRPLFCYHNTTFFFKFITADSFIRSHQYNL